jgi:hypothetical protein
LEKDFPDWNNLYNTQNVETMPWYNENLEQLESGKISKGRILDLGTGPATQAIQPACIRSCYQESKGTLRT